MSAGMTRDLFDAFCALPAHVHYNKTANGRPACEGYDDTRERIPDDEPTTKVLAEVTCLWCQELLETEVEG